MVLFPNPAGGSMEVANEAEARARGWTPSMGSFGVNSYPNGAGGGGGGAPAPQVVPQGFDANSFANAMASALGPSFGQISGFEREKLQMENALALQQLQLERDRLERLGIPELQIKQRLAQLEEDSTRRMDALAEQIQRGQLGLAYLSQAAGFAESDPFALSNFMRGAQGNPNVPQFLQNLYQNVGPRGITGPAAGAQALGPITFESLAGNMMGNPAPTAPGNTGVSGPNSGISGVSGVSGPNSGVSGVSGISGVTGGPPGAAQPQPVPAPQQQIPGVPLAFQPGAAQPIYGGTDTDKTLQTIGGIYDRGANSLAAGSLESLDTNEMNLLGAGIKNVAGTAAVPAFMEAYRRNPVRQQRSATGSVLSY